MQITPSLQNTSEIIREVPVRLLIAVADGQRLQATVIAKLAPEWVKLQIADTVLQIKTSQPLQLGQQFEVQQGIEAGKPVLRLIMPSAVVADKAVEQPVVALKQGQRLAIEVIKVLAQNRLLVTPTLIVDAADKNLTQAIHAQPLPAAVIPRQIEIDISALRQVFRPGDKLAMEVVTEQPLAIRLRPDNLTRAQLIQSYQRELLPQLDRVPPALPNLTKVNSAIPLAEPVRSELTRLVQGLPDKNLLQQAETLKQTLNNSGLFLENRLKTAGEPPVIQQDFKANLLRLAQVIRAQVQQSPLSGAADNPVLIKQLPVEIQTALRQLNTMPQDLRPLPAQVPATLASQGQTPMQLLLSLLSGLRTMPGAATTVTAAATSPPSSAVQPLNHARDSATQLGQATVRTVEWQLLRDLLREVETVSSRIQFNQLSMLKDPDSPANANVWLFDIPVKDKQQLEMLQMRLEQHHPDSSDGEEAIWQVQLNLETQNLGPMQARISLHQSDVKVVLLAEHESSANLLARHIDDLNERLARLDINVSHLSCRQAAIKPLTAVDTFRSEQTHLLDISV